jgi:thermolabile hemolysin
VKSSGRFHLAILFFVFWHTCTQAYTSFHVFGDSLSCTASNTSPASYYYNKRYSNGRVWVEVLAQQQGLLFNPSNNGDSYFGNTSSNLVAEVNMYSPPTDASNALVVIWVNNADLYYPADYKYTAAQWTNAINLSQANHYKAITNLFAKGIRTLIMPNVVDLSTIPFFNQYSETNTIHQQCLAFNAAFNETLNRARTNCRGLNICTPDFYALLTNLLRYPSLYGVSNAVQSGYGIDAVSVFTNPPLSSGPGTNFIFWDDTNPGAKVHYWMGSLAQQSVSPSQVTQIAAFNGSNRLDMANVPIGLTNDCLVLGCTNLATGNWTTNLTFTSTSSTQTVYVPAVGSSWFYKLSFPVAWKWP